MTTPLSNADELPRAVQNGMSPEEHATWMFLTDKKALDEPYTFAIKQSDLTKFITTYAEQFATAARIDAYADCGSKGGDGTEVRAYAKSRADGLSELQTPKPPRRKP